MHQITGILGDFIRAVPNGNTPPTEIVFEGNASYMVSAGRLLTNLVVTPASNTTLSIGSTVAGFDIQPPIDIPAGQSQVVDVNLYTISGQMIYFSGISSATTVKIYFG